MNSYATFNSVRSPALTIELWAEQHFRDGPETLAIKPRLMALVPPLSHQASRFIYRRDLEIYLGERLPCARGPSAAVPNLMEEPNAGVS